jgi:hypothetical protein
MKTAAREVIELSTRGSHVLPEICVAARIVECSYVLQFVNLLQFALSSDPPSQWTLSLANSTVTVGRPPLHQLTEALIPLKRLTRGRVHVKQAWSASMPMFCEAKYACKLMPECIAVDSPCGSISVLLRCFKICDVVCRKVDEKTMLSYSGPTFLELCTFLCNTAVDRRRGPERVRACRSLSLPRLRKPSETLCIACKDVKALQVVKRVWVGAILLY